MKTGMPTKVAAHVINYGCIEQLTWKEEEAQPLTSEEVLEYIIKDN